MTRSQVPTFGRHRSAAHTTDPPKDLHRSSRRAPFPGWLPRHVKLKSGRNVAVPVPAHIRVLGARLNRAQREQIRRKLGMKLGKFAKFIERITVRVKDVNRPRGGIDQICTIKVVLANLPSVVFESRHRSVNVAVGAALAGTERAVRRRLQRRRTKPIKKRALASVRLGWLK